LRRDRLGQDHAASQDAARHGPRQGGRIGHTQPRRIAARSVAARIAEELGSELGGTVGYKVRFHDKVGQRSAIKLMTDGILLAETQGDRKLREYDSIIVDEAHERSPQHRFLLGYLEKLSRNDRSQRSSSPPPRSMPDGSRSISAMRR
jgi:HrpA-like RNA helicase